MVKIQKLIHQTSRFDSYKKTRAQIIINYALVKCACVFVCQQMKKEIQTLPESPPNYARDPKICADSRPPLCAQRRF